MSAITPSRSISDGPSEWPKPCWRHVSGSQLRHSISMEAGVYGFVRLVLSEVPPGNRQDLQNGCPKVKVVVDDTESVGKSRIAISFWCDARYNAK